MSLLTWGFKFELNFPHVKNNNAVGERKLLGPCISKSYNFPYLNGSYIIADKLCLLSLQYKPN